MQADPNEDNPYSEHRKLFSTVNLSANYLCPKSLKGIFHSNTTKDSQIPLRVLFFYGNEISHFLMNANYPTDGKHYGLPIFLMLQRSLQGVAHEYAKITSNISSKSLLALGEFHKKKKTTEKLWKERLHSCYNELLPNFDKLNTPAFELMRDDK